MRQTFLFSHPKEMKVINYLHVFLSVLIGSPYKDRSSTWAETNVPDFKTILIRYGMNFGLVH